MDKEKILIIGAGPAGLATAYYLLKKSSKYEVIVLESASHVGGISKSIKIDGNIVDTGIHRFFTKNEEVQKLWEEILPIQNADSYDDKLLNKQRTYLKKGSNPEKEEKSFLIRDRITRIYHKKKYYDYPVSLSFELFKNMGFLNTVIVGGSYLKSIFFKLPETSLENFYINRFGKKLYSMFFENYTEKVWGIHPKNISPDWGSQRVKGLSIIEVLKDSINRKFNKKKKESTETSLIEQFYYPKKGSGQMYELMANEIERMGGKILLNSTVTEIFVKKDKTFRVSYKNKNVINKISVNKCISSMPIKDLVLAFKNIEVPKNIYEWSSKLPYREFMSVCFLVDKINLENKTKINTLNNVVPDSWLYIQDPSVSMGRIQIYNNWSPYIFKNKTDIKNKVLFTIEYFCSEEDDVWKQNDDVFIKFAREEAKKLNVIDDNTKIFSSGRIKIKKAYPAYFGTYENIENIKEFLCSIDNLYCIGRNGQHRYNNMDHSILTGIETAKIIINNQNDKYMVWNVNTEKEYHEIKR